MDFIQYLLVGLAAMAAGFVNALAGGGTLISFPALTAAGIPAVAANVTNTVALVPGYLGATLAQLKDLRTQRERLWLYLPAAVVGGVLGGILLLNTGEKLFRTLVPYLILLASLLLAVSDPLRSWVQRRTGKGNPLAPTAEPGSEGDGVASPAPVSAKGTGNGKAALASTAGWGALPVGLAAVYGGYFGAGLSVIILAVLGLVLNDSLTRLNALKQSISFCVNVAAAVFFLFSGMVVWNVALVMMVCALLGGALGGRLAGRIAPAVLRRVVVAIGLAVAMIYFVRG